MSVVITETARKELIKNLEEDGKSTDIHHLRVGVASGGCSGLQYFMEFEDKSNLTDEDNKFTSEDIDLVVDNKSFFYLLGSQLDYSSGLNGKGFEWSNPNANRTCGCGESFSL